MNQVLIADDDRITCRMLEVILSEWGYKTTAVPDGLAAWDLLQRRDGPRLALVDWLMPGLDGVELCRRVRALPARQPSYLILLTVATAGTMWWPACKGGPTTTSSSRSTRRTARGLQTGLRILRLQRDLAEQLRKSEEALSLVKQLQGLLPICSYCKKIRDDRNYWRQVEEYISAHSEARFSHGICPPCWEGTVLPQLERVGADGGPRRLDSPELPVEVVAAEQERGRPAVWAVMHVVGQGAAPPAPPSAPASGGRRPARRRDTPSDLKGR